MSTSCNRTASCRVTIALVDGSHTWFKMFVCALHRKHVEHAENWRNTEYINPSPQPCEAIEIGCLNPETRPVMEK